MEEVERISGEVWKGEGEAVVVADDVLTQASTEQQLVDLPNLPTLCKNWKGTDCSVSKSSFLQFPGCPQTGELYLDGEELNLEQRSSTWESR